MFEVAKREGSCGQFLFHALTFTTPPLICICLSTEAYTRCVRACCWLATTEYDFMYRMGVWPICVPEPRTFAPLVVGSSPSKSMEPRKFVSYECPSKFAPVMLVWLVG